MVDTIVLKSVEQVLKDNLDKKFGSKTDMSH